MNRDEAAIVAWSHTDEVRKNVWANRYAPGAGWAGANLWSNRYTPGSGWGDAKLVPGAKLGGVGCGDVAIDGAGNAIAVWCHSADGPSDLWSSTSSRPE